MPAVVSVSLGPQWTVEPRKKKNIECIKWINNLFKIFSKLFIYINIQKLLIMSSSYFHMVFLVLLGASNFIFQLQNTYSTFSIIPFNPFKVRKVNIGEDCSFSSCHCPTILKLICLFTPKHIIFT